MPTLGFYLECLPTVIWTWNVPQRPICKRLYPRLGAVQRWWKLLRSRKDFWSLEMCPRRRWWNCVLGQFFFFPIPRHEVKRFLRHVFPHRVHRLKSNGVNQSGTETSKTVNPNQPFPFITWLSQVFVAVTENWLTHYLGLFPADSTDDHRLSNI